MNVVIVGAGAIGLLYYQGLYTNKNIQVSLLSKQQKQKHYSFTNIEQYTKLIPINHTTKHDLQRADVLLLCVKSYQVKKTLTQLASSLSANIIIILAHNGLGTFDELPNTIKHRHCFLAMLLTHGCKKISSQHVVHTGYGCIDVGCINMANNAKTLSVRKQNDLIVLFNQCLPTIYWHQNIIEKQWLKLAINCVINPLTAINNICNGDVVKPEYHQIIINIINEVVTVAASQHIQFDKAVLFDQVIQVAKATALNQSSMLADIKKHQKTEVDYINGYISHLGKKEGIDTPTNTLLWQQVSALS